MEGPVDLVAVLMAVVALAIGVGLGWLLGARGGEQAKAASESLRLQLDGVREERDAARGEVERVQREREVATGELSALRAAEAVREEKHAEQIAQLVEIQEGLRAQFAEVGGKLLESAQR